MVFSPQAKDRLLPRYTQIARRAPPADGLPVPNPEWIIEPEIYIFLEQHRGTRVDVMALTRK
jgi:hypothetical protein